MNSHKHYRKKICIIKYGGCVDSKNLNVGRFWNQNPCGGSWDSYAELMEWIYNTEPYAFDIMKPEILKKKHILDVGCGQGMMLVHCAPHCEGIYGIDMSKESVNFARKGIEEFKIKNAVLAVGNAETLPYEDKSFDMAYSFGVLHHTHNTNDAIAEMYRVIKDDGTAIIMLYRNYTPKWAAMRVLRGMSKVVDMICGRRNVLYDRYLNRSKIHDNNPKGTALLELFGCPILKTYSKKQMRKMLSMYSKVSLKAYSPGFVRLIDIIPIISRSATLCKLLCFIDKSTEKIFGFYLVAHCQK